MYLSCLKKVLLIHVRIKNSHDKYYIINKFFIEEHKEPYMQHSRDISTNFLLRSEVSLGLVTE